MTIRIQRSRRAGWRKQANAINVDRRSDWGNPFDWKTLGRAEAANARERSRSSDRIAAWQPPASTPFA